MADMPYRTCTKEEWAAYFLGTASTDTAETSMPPPVYIVGDPKAQADADMQPRTPPAPPTRRRRKKSPSYV